MTSDRLYRLIYLFTAQRKELIDARSDAIQEWQQQYYMPTRLHQPGRRLNSLKVAVYRRQERNCK